MKFLARTDQLCNLFLNDLFDLDVVYLVVIAELLWNSGFTHRWRSNHADSDGLQIEKRKIWFMNESWQLLSGIKIVFYT